MTKEQTLDKTNATVGAPDNAPVKARIIMEGEAYGLDRIMPRDHTADIISSLMNQARSIVRLAEIEAARASYWHSAEDARNIGIAIEKAFRGS